MTPAFRIIDANANRAREAFRVLEDIARFVLDDRDLCSALKDARHDFHSALAVLPADPAVLLAWRDTPGDVGTALDAAGEHRRADLADVAGAAGSRLTEALRSIEEVSKTIAGPDGSGPRMFERLRYRAYELTRQVLAGIGPRTTPRWRLCVLITGSLCLGRSREEVADAAITGGADCVQLREKDLNDRDRLAAARAMRGLTRSRGVALVVNDRPDLALLAGADGVHVGREDLSVREVRRLAGGALLVGVSVSTVEELRAASAAGADYVGIGPMFPTTTKDKPVLAGPGALRECLADPVGSRVPHLAIGGITPGNISELAGAGATGVAVSGAVCGAADPASVCRALRAALDSPARPSASRGSYTGGHARDV